tara:strand:+ start:88 stop:459 length:372 start_codon:yes stop_codon:yes gene_type:complete
MAVTVTNQHNPIGTRLVQDTDATNSAVDHTTGAAGTLYMVEVDNSSYSTAVYFKLADATSATAGTTASTMVFYCPASSKRSYVFPEGIAFSNGFSHWCTTGAAEDNTGAPSTTPTVRYVTSAS